MVRSCTFYQLMPGCIFQVFIKQKKEFLLWVWSRSLKIDEFYTSAGDYYYSPMGMQGTVA